MDEYNGPERRSGAREIASMLARIDERTQAMKEKIDLLATKESVEHVSGDLAEHITNHHLHDGARQWKIGTWVAAVLGFSSLCLGLWSLIAQRGTP